ncbi:MAG TPA: hypothetical protein PL157_13580 [Acidobacteriota bacterium]|nr:hypothetical protein [Acidobacteriota bacterium]
MISVLISDLLDQIQGKPASRQVSPEGTAVPSDSPILRAITQAGLLLERYTFAIENEGFYQAMLTPDLLHHSLTEEESIALITALSELLKTDPTHAGMAAWALGRTSEDGAREALAQALEQWSNHPDNTVYQILAGLDNFGLAPYSELVWEVAQKGLPRSAELARQVLTINNDFRW